MEKVCSTAAMLIKSGKWRKERDELMKRQVWATVINCCVICMFILVNGHNASWHSFTRSAIFIRMHKSSKLELKVSIIITLCNNTKIKIYNFRKAYFIPQSVTIA